MNFYIKSANDTLVENMGECVLIREEMNSNVKYVTLNFPRERFFNIQDKILTFTNAIQGSMSMDEVLTTHCDNYEIYTSFYNIFY